MSAVAAAIVVGSVGAAYLTSTIGANATTKAAEIQSNAAKTTSDSAQNIYNQQEAVNKPYVEAGKTGQTQLMNYLGIGGDTGAQGYGKYATAEFTPAQFTAGQDPGYAFRMSEGLKALDKTAAARGGLLSGGALKGATAYGQGLASEEYQNAFNRYQTTRNNTLNSYQQLQGVGQAAAAGQAANLGNLGTTQANATTGAANATSAATIANANTTTGAINSATNYLTNYLGRQSTYNTGVNSDLNSLYKSGSGTIY